MVPVVEGEKEGTGFCGGGVCDDHDKMMMEFHTTAAAGSSSWFHATYCLKVGY